MTSVQDPAPERGASDRTRPRPGRTLVGFTLLLGLLFGGSFAAGRLAGPLTPGLLSPGTHGTDRGPDMPGDMPGIQMDGLRSVAPSGVSR